jgi:hypothetical protein
MSEARPTRCQPNTLQPLRTDVWRPYTQFNLAISDNLMNKLVSNGQADEKSTKRGRPRVESEAVNVLMTTDFLTLIDDWRRKQIEVPGRPEAIRRLVELGLKAKKQ